MKRLSWFGRSVSVVASALVLVLVLGAKAAFADGPYKVDTGDTAWVLASSALVLIMTPGLGLFYAGMVRRKNALATIMQSFVMCALVGVLWVVYGYSLAFCPGNGFIGGLGWVGLRHVGLEPFNFLGKGANPYGGTIPQQAHMIFQAMFAIITPALITGAFAERMRFKAFFVFMILWATFVYDPIAHWVWGMDGWLCKMGALDFAGGTVVHIELRGFRAVLCDSPRPAQGLRPRGVHAPQPDDDPSGHRSAVVRMVRL